MKHYKYSTSIAFLFSVVGMLFITGCEDVQEEITDLNLVRYLKVMNVKANSLGGTQIRLDWDNNQSADTYIVEFFADDADMAFTGNASYTLEDIENIDLPYVLNSGLEGNTTYAIRVKAVGEKADDSLWSDGITITTGGEQLFYAINEDEITHEGIIVRWIAGETVTHLLVSGGESDDLQFDFTQSEIEAGEYEITGLNSMTLYTVRLMNGGKQRGEISFTTSVDLGNAIQVNPEDDLAEIIATAENGDIFALMPGEYNINSSISITKSISIIAAIVFDKPVMNGTCFSIVENGVNLIVRNIILDGTKDDGSRQSNLTTVNSELVIGTISFESCEIKSYDKGFLSPGSSGKIDVNSYIIDDCIVHNLEATGNDAFDFRAGICRNLIITNSTLHNFMNARDFIRLDNQSNFSGNTIVTIANCTLYNIVNTEGNNAISYVGAAGNSCTVSNTIIVGTDGQLQRGNTNASYSNNAYFNATRVINIDPSGKEIDPQFADPANGDFTIMNDNLKYEGIGDPRWLP
ncbi:MAG: fibronectin type III domain-containing protein [Tannerellaceae bacterium]|nr:fibronectin type III domain-containing protein [Tannerellaceae bacterium]